MKLSDAFDGGLPQGRRRRRKWMTALGTGILSAATLAGQGNGSLTDMDIEFTETKLTLEAVADENRRLRDQLLAARQSVSALTESLAIANSEAEVFRRQVRELRLRMEALGLDAVGSDKDKLEERLLQAVQDMQLLREENEKLSGQLMALNEALIGFLKTAVSSEAMTRMALEEELRKTGELLGGRPARAEEAAPAPATLTDGMVISYKEELSLAVANLGRRHGVRIGMPFGVWRDGRQIGLVRVVDVRDKISGAVIQHLTEDTEGLKVGDRLVVETGSGF